MGVGEFLSSKANNEWILSERARENWEMENYPEGEVAEMIDIYKDRGMSQEDAEFMTMFKEYVKYEQMITDYAWTMHSMQYEMTRTSAKGK